MTASPGTLKRASAAAESPPLGLAALTDLCLQIDPQLRYCGINRVDHPLLHLPWSLLRGQAVDTVGPPAVGLGLRQACGQARSSGQPQRLSHRVPLGALGTRVFDTRISPLDEGWLLVARDMTEWLQHEAQSRDAERRDARAMRGSADGVWEWDLLANTDYLSPRCHELLGHAADARPETVGHFFDLLHPQDLSPVRAALQSHHQHGAPFDVELRLRSASGDHRWFRCRGLSERNRQGQPQRVSGTLSDITVRKQTEEALRDSQSKFSVMFHTVPVGIALLELSGMQVLEANDELARMLGLAAAEMVGRSGLQLGLWQSAAQQDQLFAPPGPSGRTDVEDWPMRARNGRPVRGRLSTQTVTVAGARQLLCAITDVTDWRAAEQALGEQRDAYAAIFNTTQDAIVSIDARGRIELFSPGAERIFGRRAEQVRGWRVDRLLAPQQRQQRAAWRHPTQDAAGHITPPGRLQGLHADGHILELEASLSPTRINGRALLTAILRDVSERVHAEAQALVQRQQLSALTQQLMDQERQTTQHLAQALHDQVGQTLTALRLSIERQARRHPKDDDTPRQLVDQALREIRQVLVDLRPPLLEDEGLLAALDNELASRHRLHPEVRLELRADPSLAPVRWPSDVEYAVFMITREAVDNALRHAAPQRIQVRLVGHAGALTLTVQDDGAGLGAGSLRARPGHLGLIGMRERARAIGADFSLGAATRAGTQLRLDWQAP